MSEGSDLTAVEVRNAARRLLGALQRSESITDINFPAVKADVVLLLRSIAEEHLPVVDPN